LLIFKFQLIRVIILAKIKNSAGQTEHNSGQKQFRVSELISGFGKGFDSYIPKPETFGNSRRGFGPHVYWKALNALIRTSSKPHESNHRKPRYSAL